MTAMEKVLSECNALAAGVTDRERRMKDRLHHPTNVVLLATCWLYVHTVLP